MPSKHVSVIPFSSCPQSFQHQGLFQWVSSSHQVAKYCSFASASVLPTNTQDWSPLGWTGWISLQSKGLSIAFSKFTLIHGPNISGSYAIDAFELWCWRRLLRVPWTARRSNQSILKINPGCSLEGMMLKLKLQYFGHLMQRVSSLSSEWLVYIWSKLGDTQSPPL